MLLNSDDNTDENENEINKPVAKKPRRKSVPSAEASLKKEREAKINGATQSEWKEFMGLLLADSTLQSLIWEKMDNWTPKAALKPKDDDPVLFRCFHCYKHADEIPLTPVQKTPVQICEACNKTLSDDIHISTVSEIFSFTPKEVM